jgi:uncharacterized membrane protein
MNWLDDGVIKTVHVLGATLLFGTGLGTAFQMWMAHRGGDPVVVASVARATVLADWLFTLPAVVLQPVTGVLLALRIGFPLTSAWIVVSTGLYLIAGACWIPVVWLQIRMGKLAEAAARDRVALPPLYHRYARIWFVLGWPAFAAMLIILHLMVTKPW